ncbi:Arc family DNA-binding protein [Photorhabdus tasmaniensis]|uniref:DNA-binding protein n=1 Tax=Photorhabdus tasmaniensis TaxID=1004159 RepID=A0ABX0GN34_9GAMM|nr:Arc family DNA-binding protein [Photorhabdus tasmaniensis]NHB89616.1 DNA-binding protein [Photorhabdus tasmaniensis]
MIKRPYKHPQVNLRLPIELKEEIAKIADKKGQSLNAEMVAAIENWVSQNSDIAHKPSIEERLVSIELDVEKIKKLIETKK